MSCDFFILKIRLLSLQEHTQCCDKNNQIGNHPYEIKDKCIKDSKQDNTYQEGYFQSTLIIIKPKNSDCILKICDHWQITDPT